MNKKNIITHEGFISLGNIELPCYVLEDGTRVLSGLGMQRSLKIVEDPDERSGSRLGMILAQKSLKPYIYQQKTLGIFEPIICYKGSQKISGYHANVLIDICDGMLEARRNIQLSSRQQIIADQCEVLVRAFAKVGLIALIDEATGYQQNREIGELQRLVNAYIAEELRPWSKTFPDAYYREIFRLRRWNFATTDIKKRPSCVGGWTNQFIYDELPLGVLEELKTRTPRDESGNYSARFFQNLNESIGEKHLKRQIITVVSLMEASDSWEQFVKLFEKTKARRELKSTD